MNFKKVFVCLFVLISMGCANRQQFGAVTGGVVGGVVASEVFKTGSAGVIGGTIIGSFIGSSIGQYMDEQDHIRMQGAMTGLPVGQEAIWSNPGNGATYSVRPVREYPYSDGHCRVAKTRVTVNGRSRQAYTTICERNGQWYVPN